MAPSYKLTYFDLNGLGAVSRLLFVAADVPYEDDRVPISFVDGKPQFTERFTDLKASGELNNNLGCARSHCLLRVARFGTAVLRAATPAGVSPALCGNAGSAAGSQRAWTLPR
jgi:hypothetical protein